MKSTFTKFTLLVLTIFVTGSLFAQQKPYEDPKYGVDSATRMTTVMNISLYSEFYKQKNYKDAVGPWRYVFENAPKASKNTYLRGANIYKNLIAREKSVARKNEMIDTLMLIYDRRVENYNGEATVLAYKGVDLYSYKQSAAAKEVSEILGRSMQLGKQKGKSAIVSTYMQAIVDQYKNDEIGPDKVIDAYTFSMETLDAIKAYREAKGDSDELEKVSVSAGNVEALFSESGAANCESLVAIFEPQFEANKDNIEWVQKVTKLLSNTECTDEPFFAAAAEQQYLLEPNAEAAHNLARLFLRSSEYDKAEKYYDEATKLQEDATTKALYYYEWCTLAMSQKDYQKVRTLARKSLEFNPNDGRPYLKIGVAYAQTKGIGKETVEHKAVYWAAVDKFVQAKNVDASVADQANEYIATYSKYYPNFEEWFMAIGSKEGETYTVGGWINEATKIRF